MEGKREGRKSRGREGGGGEEWGGGEGKREGRGGNELRIYCRHPQMENTGDI